MLHINMPASVTEISQNVNKCHVMLSVAASVGLGESPQSAARPDGLQSSWWHVPASASQKSSLCAADVIC